MTRYDGLVRSVMAGRGTPTALGEAIDALQRALAALENPTTLEERQVLVRALVDYSNMFTGAIEGPEADARSKLNARERAFAEAQQLAADDPVRAEAAVRLGIALLGTNATRSEQLIR